MREGAGRKDTPPRDKPQMQRKPQGPLSTRHWSPGGCSQGGEGHPEGQGMGPQGWVWKASWRRWPLGRVSKEDEQGQRHQPQRPQKGHGQRAAIPASHLFLQEKVTAHLPCTPCPHAKTYRHRRGSEKALEGCRCSQMRSRNRGGERDNSPCASGGSSGEGGLSPSQGASIPLSAHPRTGRRGRPRQANRSGL